MPPSYHHSAPARRDPIAAYVASYGALLLVILVSGLLVVSVQELWAGIASIALLTVAALVLSRMELLHPYTWYMPVLFLYSASVPVFVWVGVRPETGSLHETIFTQWLAMAAFMLVVGPPSVRKRAPIPRVPLVGPPATVLYIASLGMSAAYVYGILSNGLSTKFAIALSSSPLLRLGAAFSLLSLAFAVLLGNALQHRRMPWLLVATTIAWVAMAFAYSGERALVFRILWISLILVHALYYRITATVLFVAGAGALLLVSVLSDYKARHLSEFEYSGNTLSVTPDRIAQLVFADEFITASENLQVLIDSSPWAPYHGETLLWDWQQVMHIGERGAGPSPTAYFNNYFFPDYVKLGGGRGFTLAGEGYMNFGPAGAALWFVILGVFVRLLYELSRRHLFWLVGYALTMPLVAYATRADFSNILSPFIKHIIGPIIFIILLRALLLRRKSRAAAHASDFRAAGPLPPRPVLL